MWPRGDGMVRRGRFALKSLGKTEIKPAVQQFGIFFICARQAYPLNPSTRSPPLLSPPLSGGDLIPFTHTPLSGRDQRPPADVSITCWSAAIEGTSTMDFRTAAPPIVRCPPLSQSCWSATGAGPSTMDLRTASPPVVRCPSLSQGSFGCKGFLGDRGPFPGRRNRNRGPN